VFKSTNRTVFASVKIALTLFSRREKSQLLLVATFQVLLGFLDLMGVVLLGLLGTLAVSGVQSVPTTGRVAEVLDFFSIADLTLQSQVAIIGSTAAILLAVKTALSLAFTRKTLRFLSNKSAKISLKLLQEVLGKSLIELREKSSQATLYSVTLGVSAITMGIVGTLLALATDISLLMILFSGLLLVDINSALFSVFFFALIGLALYRIMNVKVKKYSLEAIDTSIHINERILEVVNSYRESVVRNRRDFYISEIGQSRIKLAGLEAELGFFPNISKYVVDLALVFGALGISALQFLFSDAKHAVGSILIFLVAGMRIGPAVMRVQQQAILLKNATSNASSTLDLANNLIASQASHLPVFIDSYQVNQHAGFSGTLLLDKLSFKYPGATSDAVKDINLQVEGGKSVAIVGPSGAGKTTLVDLILGIFPPDSGNVLISGTPPLQIFAEFPGAVSYVPQDVFLSNRTIRENVSLGFNSSITSDAEIWTALEGARLADFVRNLPEGLSTLVGENGAKLSGGQKQRIGIARALFTNPKFLVLDEATSALDGETENEVTEAIQDLRGQVTVIMIAHRLSTVRNADLVVYIDNGEIIAKGNFDEIRRKVPNFDNQATLLGLENL
jgi:ABC-type multidrug transport system fused ATPase/permease subunit